MYGTKDNNKPIEEKKKKKKKTGPKKKGNPLSPLLEKVLAEAIKNEPDVEIMKFEWMSAFKGKVIVSRHRGNSVKAPIVQENVNAILESKKVIVLEEKKLVPQVAASIKPNQPSPPQALQPNQPQPAQTQPPPPSQGQPQPVGEQTAPVGREASELKAVYISRAQYSQWSPSKPSVEPRQYWEVLFLMGQAASVFVKTKKTAQVKAPQMIRAKKKKKKQIGIARVGIASGTIGVGTSDTTVAATANKTKRKRRRKKKKNC